MKLSELSLKYITLIQVSIAITLSLIFHFLIPDSWRPLTAYLGEENKGYIYAIFTLSQWLFSFSIAWFLRRDNPYINSYFFWSILPLLVVFFMEFFLYLLFYDYIHILPLIIVIYILWKKRETLNQKLIIIYTIFLDIWYAIDYYYGLAYQGYPLILATLLIYVYPIVVILFSFLFRNNQKEEL